MLKSILTICISGLMGLLILSFVLPKQAALIADEVLGSITHIKDVIPEAILDKEEKVETPTDDTTDKPVDSKGSTTTGKTPTKSDTGPLSIENIIDSTNRERVKAGLVPLKPNTKLNASAKVKVNDMIARQYFEHVSPSGESVSDLGKAQGYDYILMGENLALGNFGSSDELLTAWMNSPGHRANILNNGYQEIGVYAGRGTYQGRTVWFAVQHFGTARGVCPAIDEKLKTSIDTTNAQLKAQETQIATMRAKLEAPDHPQGQAYEDMVNTFNALVAKYNSDLAVSQKKIASYNAVVKAFNACLAVYQK